VAIEANRIVREKGSNDAVPVGHRIIRATELTAFVGQVSHPAIYSKLR